MASEQVGLTLIIGSDRLIVGKSERREMAFLKRTLRVGSKGQITLPQEIRQDLELRQGDLINIYKLEDNLYILERLNPIREISRSIAAEAEAEGYSEEEVRERVDRVKEELLREIYRTYPTTGTR